MSATLREALLERMRSVLTPIYDGVAEIPTTPTTARYAVLHDDPGALSSDDVANTPRLVRHYPQVTAVGTTSQQVGDADVVGEARPLGRAADEAQREQGDPGAA